MAERRSTLCAEDAKALTVNACPEWADNDVPEKPPAPWPRLRRIDGGKNEAPVD
jgi:hypothetical protein